MVPLPSVPDDGRARVSAPASLLVPALAILRDGLWHRLRSVYGFSHAGDPRVQLMWDGPGPHYDRWLTATPDQTLTVAVPRIDRLPRETAALAALDARLSDLYSWDFVPLTKEETAVAARWCADFHEDGEPQADHPDDQYRLESLYVHRRRCAAGFRAVARLAA